MTKPHIPWHLSAFHPDYKMLEHQSTKLETLQRAYSIGKKAGLKYIYLGNVPVHGDTYCPKYQTLLIDRKGFSITTNIMYQGHCPECGEAIEGIWS